METHYTEKRKYARHPANEDALIFCPERYGQVIDISRGGMAIKMIDNPEPLPETWETTFFCLATNSKVENLPLKIVRKEPKEFSRFDITYQTIGVQFNNPTDLQKEQIKRVIWG